MDDSDGGDMADTPPSARKQKKAPAPKKAKVANPLQSKENESELDIAGAGEASGAPKEKKSAADAYQKVCI
jgi:DNA topoisomerase-2